MIRKWLLGPPSVVKNSQKIYNLATVFAFRIFRDKNVREWLEFSELTEQEQDRIFNELVVTTTLLAYLMTETLINFHDGEFRGFLKEVKNRLERIHQETLTSLAVEKHLVKMWDDLIALRLNEYRQEYNEHRHELPNVEEDNPWILVTGVGGYDHITRGKGKPTDPFYKYLIKKLIKLSYDINGIFINALKRFE